MEDTFMVVREGGEFVAHDESMAVGVKLLPDDLMEGSQFRIMPDDAAGFEEVLLRGDIEQPIFEGERSMPINFLDQSRF